MNITCRLLVTMGLLNWIFGCRDDKPTTTAAAGRTTQTNPAPPAARPVVVQAAGVPTAGAGHVPVAAYTRLRERIFAVRPGEDGLPSDGPLAAVMETENPDTVMTLLALADGTTSVYLSAGGGLIGGGTRDDVRAASGKFLRAVSAAGGQLSPTTEHPLPGAGRVRFYLISADGVRTAEVPQDDLFDIQHPLSSAFDLGHRVVTAARKYHPVQN